MRILLLRRPCGGCGSAAPVWSDVCLRCGRVLHPPERLRAAGVLYLGLGVLLTGAAAYLIALVAGIVARSDDPEATWRFTGDAGALALVFGALGFVLVVGVTGLLMGLWQIRHGRRNLALVRLAMLLYLVFWTVAVAVQLLG
jgi:MFS family permease